MKWIKTFESFKINESLIIPKEYVDFVNFLEKDFNIDTKLYGTGTYKTIGHLWKEIEEGETQLSEENGKLVRKVQFVGARIIFKKAGEWWRLYEEKQIFKDGRERRRKNMPYSAAEKFKENEDPTKVIIRGMKEELDLDVKPHQFVFYNKTVVENNDDYPGIKSIHNGFEFLVILENEQFKEEGYIERQSDKDVYFTWRRMTMNESMILEKYLQ